MSDWDKIAADAAIEYAKPTMRPVQTMSDHMADAFHEGTRWQREALLSDEIVARAAQDRDIVQMAEDSGADEPWIVRTVLAAAIGAEQ